MDEDIVTTIRPRHISQTDHIWTWTLQTEHHITRLNPSGKYLCSGSKVPVNLSGDQREGSTG